MPEEIPLWMMYSASLEETVELIESGMDFSDLNTEELMPLVYDLLRANRADLALPYYLIIYKNVDELIDFAIKHHYEDNDNANAL